MKIDRLKQMATELEDAFRRQNDLREEISEICTVMKANADITTLELRAVKRIVKARAADKIEGVRETMEGDQRIFDILTGTNNLYVRDHDPETGGVNEAPDMGSGLNGEIPVAPPSGADEDKIAAPCATVYQGNQSGIYAHGKPIDTRTANEIIGDDPIPAFLDRRAS